MDLQGRLGASWLCRTVCLIILCKCCILFEKIKFYSINIINSLSLLLLLHSIIIICFCCFVRLIVLCEWCTLVITFQFIVILLLSIYLGWWMYKDGLEQAGFAAWYVSSFYESVALRTLCPTLLLKCLGHVFIALKHTTAPPHTQIGGLFCRHHGGAWDILDIQGWLGEPAGSATLYSCLAILCRWILCNFEYCGGFVLHNYYGNVSYSCRFRTLCRCFRWRRNQHIS